MRVVISSGHGKKIRGASGYIDEVDEARQVVESVADALRDLGTEVVTYHDDVSTTQSENLNRIVDFHNAQTRDMDVSVHFNAYQTTSKPMGCEVLYVSSTGLEIADRVVDDICEAADFINRGPKKRTDLAFLNGTEEPAILVETCFVDSKADVDIYHAKYAEICSAIAAGIANTEAVPKPPPADGAFYNITATVFGGSSETEKSAYDEHVISETEVCVALPWRFEGERPLVEVSGPSGTAVGTIEDVGPWMIDDDYWSRNVRPLVEEYYAKGKPLPRGPNKGRVPSNDAGIDLSPAMAKKVGVDGKGKVGWWFHDETQPVPEPGVAEVRIEIEGEVKVWVNGKLVT
jgi:N-acetylmuramoyl-L-alanine amidase